VGSAGSIEDFRASSRPMAEHRIGQIKITTFVVTCHGHGIYGKYLSGPREGRPIGPLGHHLAPWHYPNVVEPPRRPR
jgi:hypothetical protein